MNLESTRPRCRPRNRWQDEVREDWIIAGGEEWHEKVYNREEWKKLLRTARNRRILHMPMVWNDFGKYTNIKFHENPSSGSWVVPCKQMGRRTDMTKLTVASQNFVKAPKNYFQQHFQAWKMYQIICRWLYTFIHSWVWQYSEKLINTKKCTILFMYAHCHLHSSCRFWCYYLAISRELTPK
jgi:hypothetical protein